VQHHIIGPSKLPRLQHCVGSLYGPGVDEGSSASREGTACHALLEFCLAMSDDPRAHLVSTAFSEEFPVTIEMVEAVELFIDTVKAKCDEVGIPHDRIKSEAKLVHSKIPNNMFGGTMDCQAAGDDVLIIADLKFGRRQVYADSPQLTAYSLLSLDTLNPPPKRVIQMIIQPRGSTPVSVHEVGQEELWSVWGIVSAVAQAVTEKPDLSQRAPLEMLNAGEHCKYCSQRNGCPALTTMVTEVTTIGTFENPDTKALIVAPTQEIPTEELVKWVDRADAIKEFLDDCDKALKVRASQGQVIPGRKLVLRYGHRTWTDDDMEAMAKRLPRAKLGLAKKDVMVTKLGTPAQVEKILKERGVLKDKEAKDRFNRLTQSKPIGVRLVPEASKGEAIRPEVAVEFLKLVEADSDE
jgi:hypothetical protein